MVPPNSVNPKSRGQELGRALKERVGEEAKNNKRQLSAEPCDRWLGESENQERFSQHKELHFTGKFCCFRAAARIDLGKCYRMTELFLLLVA